MSRIKQIKDFFIKHGWIKTIVGIIITAIITANVDKACNRVSPEEPVIVKEITDTIKIVHTYDFDEYNDSIVNMQLRYKLENIELAQMYEEKISNRIKDPTQCNSIMVGDNFKCAKGYSLRDAAPYFTLNMSPLDKEFIDFELHFFDKKFLSNIFCLNLKIHRIDNGRRVFVLDENYYVNESGNKIRIANTLSLGLYEFSVGFVLKKDKNLKYPIIYQITKKQRK